MSCYRTGSLPWGMVRVVWRILLYIIIQEYSLREIIIILYITNKNILGKNEMQCRVDD